MGQYFKAVNLDKKEVVCPWCLGGGAKLWEWAASPHGALFTLLLRRSSGGGGGDYYGYKSQDIVLDANNPAETILTSAKAAVSMEGRPIPGEDDAVVGRWAGDRIVLVGDYDESGLFEESDSFRNISEELVDAWNAFIGLGEMKLEYRPECSCHDKALAA